MYTQGAARPLPGPFADAEARAQAIVADAAARLLRTLDAAARVMAADEAPGQHPPTVHRRLTEGPHPRL